MAFDATVRKQIEKLRIPSLKCVDMVVSKLTDVLQQCSDKVSKYNRLINYTNKLSILCDVFLLFKYLIRKYACVYTNGKQLPCRKIPTNSIGVLKIN